MQAGWQKYAYGALLALQTAAAAAEQANLVQGHQAAWIGVAAVFVAGLLQVLKPAAGT